MPQYNLEFYTPFDKPTYVATQQIIRFLVQNSEQDKSNINKAVEYAIKERPSYGGFIVVAQQHDKILGVAVLNQTGLSGIMPDYLLSYMVVDNFSSLQEEIKQKLIQKSLELSRGNIAMLTWSTLKERETMPTLCYIPVENTETKEPNNKSSEEFGRPRIRTVG